MGELNYRIFPSCREQSGRVATRCVQDASQNGFSVTEARNGSDRLDAIREQSRSIDVLLLDNTLPGAPSWQVFEEAN